MPVQNKLAVSVAEMAELLSVSRPTAYEIIRRSDFHGAFKSGRRTLVSVAGIQEWIKKQIEDSEL